MTRWELIAPPEKDMVESLSTKLGISELLSAILVQRGYSNEELARRFLWPEISHLHTPFAIDGMTAAVERIQLALQRKERVGVFGDYDVDGIVSTAILVLALRDKGLDVIYRLPERLTEGYGLSQDGLRDLAQNGAKLIITVDCGISSLTELRWAKENGLDVIICDHHLPPLVLPPAVAILNPKVLPNQYPFNDLAGAGVALKLACALHQELDYRWLELAALGTVADVVPLVDENRVIVAEGLKAMKSTGFAGLRALCELANLNLANLKAGSIGFRLAPRLNAAGRLGSAIPGVELFITDDETKAYEIAQQLDQQNRERQQIEAEVLAQAIDQVERYSDLKEDTALVVAGEDWHPGVIGIVASRLVDRWHRPALVISLSDDKGKGSGRSIPGFSLFEGLKQCSSYLTAFGGHRLAAGFSLKREQCEAFRQVFLSVANSQLSPEDCVSYRRVDAEVSLDSLNLSVAQELELLAPFGYGNPEPVLLLQGVETERVRQIGNSGTHLRLDLNHFGHTLPAIGFGLGDMATELTSAAKIDVLGFPVVTEWQGLVGVEMRLKDVRTKNCPSEISCRPGHPAAPRLVDWRGFEGMLVDDQHGSSSVTECHLVFSQPPEQLSKLQERLVRVPPKGKIGLHFGPDEVAAAKNNIKRKFLDRNFMAHVYLVLKGAGATGTSWSKLVAELGCSEQELELKVRPALAILQELNLAEKYLVEGRTYFRLADKAGEKRVKLRTSPTFKKLELEKMKALELTAFFAEAPSPILAEALARLWQESVTIAEK